MLKALGSYRLNSDRAGSRKIVANSMFGGNPLSSMAGSGNFTASAVSGYYARDLLEGFINPNQFDNSASGSVLRAIYRDMYYHDPVCGSAVDLISEIPFSSISLSGLPDQHMTDVYAKACENINIINMFPEMTRDYLVSGTYVGVLNTNDGDITGIMPQSMDNVEVVPLPVYGHDPILNLKIPQQLVNLIEQSKKDDRIKFVLQQYGDDILEQVKQKIIKLKPKDTIYIPRRTLSTRVEGTSYYRRVLPMWILEKALLRGTMELAYRRQKSILHITCLTGDTLIDKDGELVRLDSICLFDETITRGTAVDVDFTTRAFFNSKPVKVDKWVYQGIRSIYEIKTKNGLSLRATKDHKILVYSNDKIIEMKKIEDLCINDTIYTYTERFGRDSIISIIDLNKKEHVYDLSIQNGSPPIFFANGIAVHNCGSDEWEPTDQQLGNIVDMFLKADLDPTGPIIATRPDINPSEVRSPTDFWQATEYNDYMTTMKLRGMGLGESFLSGEMTIATLDSNLSIFLEQIRSYRDMITNKILYKKIFARIAYEKNFKATKEKQMVVGNADDQPKDFSYHINKVESRFVNMANDDQFVNIDTSEYHIPKVTWHKQLKPESDDAYLGILSTLEEKGLPIPLRLLAAAGGLSLPDILNSLDDDVVARKKIDNYKNKLPKPPQDDSGVFAALNDMTRYPKKNRDFSNTDNALRDPDTLKTLSRKGAKVQLEKLHKVVAERLAESARRENHLEKQKPTPQEKIFGI